MFLVYMADYDSTRALSLFASAEDAEAFVMRSLEELREQLDAAYALRTKDDPYIGFLEGIDKFAQLHPDTLLAKLAVGINCAIGLYIEMIPLEGEVRKYQYPLRSFPFDEYGVDLDREREEEHEDVG